MKMTHLRNLERRVPSSFSFAAFSSRSDAAWPTSPAVFICVAALIFPSAAAEVPKAPVPKSPYLPIVYRYADTMLEQGRDTYGPQKTGLFLSALDRSTVTPPTNRPPAPIGIRENERVATKDTTLLGANPQHDENLLRLLYTLSELSAKPKYREAADAELKWLLQMETSLAAQFLAWGGRLSWNVIKDEPALADDRSAAARDWFRPWMLWDRCYSLAPEASERVALALGAGWVPTGKSAGLGRNTDLNSPVGNEETVAPRQAGFCIRTWAVAYAQTKDDRFCAGIDALLDQLEKKRSSKTGERHATNSNESASSRLSLAIDCNGAAHLVPEVQAARLRAFAAREDEIFCAWPHDLKRRTGFAGEPAAVKPDHRPTPLWNADNGGNTTARVGMMCVARYENTGKLAYRNLIFAAADAYLNSLPAADEDVWAGTFGQAISLEVAAWRHSAKPAYLESARKLADWAVERFWGTNALPRASLKTDHYETITGADTLALALVELHLNILHITAVRCPLNTIDR